MQQDENITKNLSKETMQLIETKENLKSEGYSEEVLDMDFIDKLLESKPQGKKDLSTLLRMYKSVLIMASDPIYHSPNKTSKAPSKKKKPGKK